MRHALASLLASLASKVDSLSSHLSPDPPAPYQGNASPHGLPNPAHRRTAPNPASHDRASAGADMHQQPAPPLSPPDKRQRTPVHLDLRTGTLTVRTRHGWQPLTLASLGLPTHPPLDAGSGHPAHPSASSRQRAATHAVAGSASQSGHAAGQKPGGMGRRAWELDTDMESLDPPSWEGW